MPNANIPIERNSVDVSLLHEPGRTLLVNEPQFQHAFIARVQTSRPPLGSVPADTPGEYFVAFSRLCTHMGAHVVGSQHELPDSSPALSPDGLVRCPAHLTCFDLCQEGLVVIGQACASLPQIKLLPVCDGHVRLVEWLSPPYGEVDP